MQNKRCVYQTGRSEEGTERDGSKRDTKQTREEGAEAREKARKTGGRHERCSHEAGEKKAILCSARPDGRL